jgi:hypothetical protein
MSKRDERFNRVDELLLTGMADEDIIAHVCDEYSVKPATVEKDIEALRAQDEPLPFGDDDTLLEDLLSNKVDAHEADLSQINYEVPKGEEKFVHALIEVPTYNDGRPPKKDSKPRVQKFDAKSWTTFATYHVAQGYVIHKVLHLPKGIKPLEEMNIFGAERKA